MKVKISHVDVINGEIKISGSKNAALPIIVSTLLTEEKVTLYNIPVIDDVLNLLKILKSIGSKIEFDYKKNKLTIINSNINTNVANENVSKLRASYYLMGALISSNKSMSINFPGGCNFSSRPIELHLKAFKLLNIKININKKITLKTNQLKSNDIYFPIISVGATINTILSSVFIKGITTIYNASIEPEVIDTINFINSLGGNIKVLENRVIKIYGVTKLNGGCYKIMFDRIEAGSYLLLTSTRPNSKIKLLNVDYTKMLSTLQILKKIGCKINYNKNKIVLISPEQIRNVNIEVGPYPSIPTDLQPILSVVLLNGNKQSTIKDNIYSDRVSHIDELKKMNAEIMYNLDKIIINSSKLIGSTVISHDLRCAFALIVASTMAKGITIIDKIDYIKRGYEKIEEKLNKLGIKLMSEN